MPANCKICGVTDEAMFYTSIKTYCKEHWRERVRKNRAEKFEYYRSFDKARANLPHRVEARKQYRASDQGKISVAKAHANYMNRYPERYEAQTALGNAIRDGRVIRQPCLICGDKNSEGHHPDYSDHLSVVWLCNVHHRQAHELVKDYRP